MIFDCLCVLIVQHDENDGEIYNVDEDDGLILGVSLGTNTMAKNLRLMAYSNRQAPPLQSIVIVSFDISLEMILDAALTQEPF